MTDQERTVRILDSAPHGKRYDVTTSLGDTLKLDPEIVFRYSLFTDHEFPPERWREIMTDANHHACFNAALRLLEQRPRTTSEMRTSLRRRKFDSASIRSTLAKAAEMGLLNDERFARQYAEEKLDLAMLGPRRVQLELRKRGLQREQIDDAMAHAQDNLGGDHEWETVKKLADRKWKSLARETDPQKRKKRLLTFLAGRGFRAELCYRVLRTVSRTSQNDTDE